MNCLHVFIWFLVELEGLAIYILVSVSVFPLDTTVFDLVRNLVFLFSKEAILFVV